MKKFIPYCTLFATALVSLSALAVDPEVMNARKTDIANQYQLTSDGRLYRWFNDVPCKVAENVSEFKVSTHPEDSDMIYYVQNGNLRGLMQGQKPTRWFDYYQNAYRYDCSQSVPSEDLLRDLAVGDDGKYRYTLVKRHDTTVTNMALSKSGELKAWDHEGVVLHYKNVRGYLMNESGCYGNEGKRFGTYVAFAEGFDGTILKIKGKDPEGSKFDTKKYDIGKNVGDAVRNFKKAEKVCEDQAVSRPRYDSANDYYRAVDSNASSGL